MNPLCCSRLRRAIALAATLLPFSFSLLHAQVVADGTTNTLSNVTNAITGDVIVGTNGTFTLLVLSDNALLTNSANGVISKNATASANEARLISPTARWMMNNTLYVGSNGAAARLVVSNGAFVRNNSGIIGNLAASVSNQVLVTISGSVWSNASDLTVGFVGNGNLMVVSNSGGVASAGGYIGRNGGNNLALVNGVGSVWSNRLDLSIGIFSSTGVATNNGLSVQAGGQVFSQNGLVGGGAGSSNSFALLTGVGSLWSNRVDLTVGSSEGNQRLIVSNGAALFNGNGTVGGGSSAANNSLAVVTGTGSVWSNRDDFNLGYFGVGNRLEVRAGGMFVNSNAYLGLSTTSTNNIALVTGSGSVWSNRADLVVGDLGYGAQLVVSNGAAVNVGGSGVIGRSPGTVSNSVLVTDAGSRWTVASNLYLGSNGVAGSLVVSNGGWVDDLNGFIGAGPASSNNLAIVTGAGSVWSNRAALNLGLDGSGNRLTVTNSGLVVVSSNVIVGVNASATNNTLLVDGGTLRASNATGTASLELRRGTLSLNSGVLDMDRLILTNKSYAAAFAFNGGTLITRGASIYDPGESYTLNIGTSTSHPAVWDVRAGTTNTHVDYGLVVGRNSWFNQVLVTNGAYLYCYLGVIIGLGPGGDSNSVVISTPGSQWTIPSAGNLTLGEISSFNRLVVSNGAVLATGGNALIGVDGASSNNSAVITGTGSTWNCTNGLYVGFSGYGNMLVVSNGGLVISSNIVIGSVQSATNSRMVVDGGALQVTNATVTAVLDVRRGTNVLNSGLVNADWLLVTNTLGQFEFNSGTLKTAGTIVSNGRIFNAGDGTASATFQLQGGSHNFVNGLVIPNNATLVGTGTIVGSLVVASGGTIQPGDGIGTLVLNNTPNLGGAIIMEALKVGASRINDVLQVAGPLFYGGSLTVNNVGIAAFSAGDSFKLFNATAYGSSFSQLNLPPLNAGLTWTNKLAVDGSIAVIAVSQPKFTGVGVSGTNLIFSGSNGNPGLTYAVLTTTNVATTAANWQSLITNQFGVAGQFSFTNGINHGESQRYFRLRTP